MCLEYQVQISKQETKISSQDTKIIFKISSKNRILQYMRKDRCPKTDAEYTEIACDKESRSVD